jgi:hypothetical protein
MTTREKKLAYILGGAIALGALYQGVNVLALGPLRAMDEDIAKARKDSDKLERELRAARRKKKSWARFAKRTIGTEDNQAELSVWLNSEIIDLVTRAGMSKINVKPGQSRGIKKTRLISLPYTVTAEGPLSSVTNFLYEFYTWPFNIKISSLEINPRKGRSATNMVRMEAKIEALIVPLGEDLPKVTTAELEPELRPEPDRELHPDGMQAYALIGSTDIFSGREPKPPPRTVTKVPEPRARPPQREPRVTPPPTSPPSRDRQVTVVRALLTYPGKQEVVTFNELSQERKVVAIGERIEGDTKLLRIHPYGAIAQADDNLYYLYPLSKPFTERERIEETNHPMLWRWLNPAIPAPPNRPAETDAETGQEGDSALSAMPSIDELRQRLVDMSEEDSAVLDPAGSGDWRIPQGSEYTDLDHTSNAGS